MTASFSQISYVGNYMRSIQRKWKVTGLHDQKDLNMMNDERMGVKYCVLSLNIYFVAIS